MPTYSLWLEAGPTSPALPRLAAVIGSGPGPAFVPHVTLVGGVHLRDDDDAAGAARAVAARLPPSGVRVKLTQVATGTTYHQSVYALVDKTPEVGAAAAAARAAVGGLVGDDAAAGASFMPHVSLLYSDDAADRRAFADACARDVDLGAASFDGVRVTAWRTEGEVEQWALVTAVEAGQGAGDPLPPDTVCDRRDC